MKTLIVGDLHLLGTTVLPIVDQVQEKEKVEKIVLLGDYFDQWGQSSNANLYLKEATFLQDWVQDKRKFGIDVVCLLGNHDVPYLTGNLRHYSIHDRETIVTIKSMLISIEARLCVEIEGYFISHAGFAGENKPEVWYFERVDVDRLGDLDLLEKTVGFGRGGRNRFGSLLWADYVRELSPHYNPDYPKQIVGHTPVKKATNSENNIWVADTFSLYQNHDPIGNGDLLLIENGVVSVVSSNIAQVIYDKNQEKNSVCCK